MRIAQYITASAALAVLFLLPACNGSGAGQSTIGRQALTVAKESRQEAGPSYSIGPQYEDEMSRMIIQEAAALGVEEGKEGVPMELNREVLLNINYFLNNARGFMTRSLSRGSKYIPMMKAIFRQKGLPEDLVYLALIESGFQTAAVSRASAVGPWQFIASTGRRYGLAINDYVDERMDPVKSTYAAADYLTALHDMFNSWPLAIAAYNSGEGKILKGMKNYGVSNFWDMSDVSGHLAAETRLYVPSFLAATFIAKDPGAYGLEIERQEPDQWDEAVMPTAITFAEAAKMAGTVSERLEELNPHLRKKTTPPNETDFVLRIPAGTLDSFAAAYEKSGLDKTRTASLEDIATVETVAYTIKSGDTKTGIALMSGQEWADIAALNKLDKNYRLMPGKTIQVAKNERKKTASLVPPQSAKSSPDAVRTKRATARKTDSSPRISTITHKVQRGDTLASIAKLYGVPMDSIKTSNNMRSNTVYRGQILRIKSDLPLTAAAAPRKGRSRVMVVESKTPASAATSAYTVVKGDTLMVIAREYGMSAKELADINNIRGVTITVGQKLKVRGQAKSAATAPGSASAHTVAKGETLGAIAQKYKIGVNDLMRINGLKGTNIKVGQTLKLRVAPPPPPKKAETAKKEAAPKTETPRAATVAAKAGGNGSSQAAPGTHTVVSGETVYSIAKKYNLSSEEFLAINPGISGNKIRAGQTLAVSPPKPKVPATHKVAQGDTLYNIATKNNLTVDALRKLNGLKGDRLRPGQTLKLR